jgi:hypothetical protein
MPAHDLIHESVKSAIIKDGWTITHDPCVIAIEGERLLADPGAERPFAAERGDERIVVEVKSFLGPSLIRDFEEAIGQYWLYRDVLWLSAPESRLYLALRDIVYETLAGHTSFDLLMGRQALSLLIVDIEQEEIVRWIGRTTIAN